jgi:hypothetical protein
VHSDSTNAFTRCYYVGADPTQSQASRIAEHAHRLLLDEATADIERAKTTRARLGTREPGQAAERSQIRTDHWRSAVGLLQKNQEAGYKIFFILSRRVSPDDPQRCTSPLPQPADIGSAGTHVASNNPGSMRMLLVSPPLGTTALEIIGGIRRGQDHGQRGKSGRDPDSAHGLLDHLGERGEGGGRLIWLSSSSFHCRLHLVKGTHTPRIAHSARYGRRNPLCCVWGANLMIGLQSTYPLGTKDSHHHQRCPLWFFSIRTETRCSPAK